MHVYDVAVVGAGAAGMMAAIRAGQLEKDVVLIERNDVLGKKIMLTGKGRCNITNRASRDTFIEKFGKQGDFLRSAFGVFFNDDLIDFFKKKGLALKVERQGRVFPVTDKADSVVAVLKEYLLQNKVAIFYNARLLDIAKRDVFFQLLIKDKGSVRAQKVILATGGVSFRKTGSAGDGFRLAEKMGHSIVPLRPVLVPLKTREPWVKELQGLALKNIRITFKYGKKKIVSDVGELIFTHFGVSGPLVLDLSGAVVARQKKQQEMCLLIDLKPAREPEQLERKLLREFKVKGNMMLKNYMRELLPRRLVAVFIRLAGLDPASKINQITQQERRMIINLLKALPLTITGSLPLEEAMVTGGGVATKEINPRTMESRIVPGLYFAGEVIDGCAPSGGYNLQQAFSTGWLAGEMI